LSGGSLSADNEYTGYYGTGVFEQTGGTNTVSNNVLVGYNSGGNGTFKLSGGDLQALNEHIGYWGTGVFRQTGGTNTVSNRLLLGYNAGGDGTYYLGDASSTGALNVDDMTVRNRLSSLGTFQGWGSVSGSGTLTNNGIVIADGYGTDRVLDLSGFTTIDNPYDNTTNNGWFAVNQGKLTLPAFSVSPGSSINWGEAQSDTQIDLVNSIYLQFDAGVIGGTLELSLLASDFSLIPSGLTDPIGIWDFDDSAGFDFGTGDVDLTFRFDDALASLLGIAETDLALYHYYSGAWNQVPIGINTVNNHISGTVNHLSYLAIARDTGGPGVIPEPSTIILMLLGFMGLCIAWRRKKVK
jgi:hypothetical protein